MNHEIKRIWLLPLTLLARSQQRLQMVITCPWTSANVINICQLPSVYILIMWPRWCNSLKCEQPSYHLFHCHYNFKISLKKCLFSGQMDFLYIDKGCFTLQKYVQNPYMHHFKKYAKRKCKS